MAHIIGHVEKSGTHQLRWRKEKTATYNNHNYNHITISLEIVGMHYSLPIMFHVCVPSWEEERKHSSQESVTQHTSLGMWKRVGLTD